MNLLADFFLIFGNSFFIISFILFGIHFINRTVFINTLLVLVFISILNAYLKYYFQVPLNPLIAKQGWAYPSGHTAFNVVFWGALCIQLRKRYIFLAAIGILVPFFWAMVYKQYHTWVDIMGGLYTSGLVLVAFYYWIRYRYDKCLSLSMFILPISTVIYCFLPHHILDYNSALMMLGLNAGIIIALVFKLPDEFNNTKAKIISFAASLSLSGLIFLLMPLHFLKGLFMILSVLLLVPKLLQNPRFTRLIR